MITANRAGPRFPILSLSEVTLENSYYFKDEFINAPTLLVVSTSLASSVLRMTVTTYGPLFR